jgi:hypothetical protein
MDAKVAKLYTDKLISEERVLRVVAAIDQMGPELSAVACFGKCKDGTFVTMTANALDPATLGYSQAQLSSLSADLAYRLNETAHEIDLPDVD